MPRDEFDSGKDEDGGAGNPEQNFGNSRNEELRARCAVHELI